MIQLEKEIKEENKQIEEQEEEEEEETEKEQEARRIFLQSRKQQIEEDTENKSWYSKDNIFYRPELEEIFSKSNANSILGIFESLQDNYYVSMFSSVVHYPLVLRTIGTLLIFLFMQFFLSPSIIMFFIYVTEIRSIWSEFVSSKIKVLFPEQNSSSSSLPTLPKIEEEKERKSIYDLFPESDSKINEWCYHAFSSYVLLFWCCHPHANLINCWILLQIISCWIIVSGQKEKGAIFWFTLLCWIPQVHSWLEPEHEWAQWWKYKETGSWFGKLEYTLLLGTLFIYAKELYIHVSEFINKNILATAQDKMKKILEPNPNSKDPIIVPSWSSIYLSITDMNILIHSLVQFLLLFLFVDSSWSSFYCSLSITCLWSYWQYVLYDPPIDTTEITKPDPADSTKQIKEITSVPRSSLYRFPGLIVSFVLFLRKGFLFRFHYFICFLLCGFCFSLYSTCE